MTFWMQSGLPAAMFNTIFKVLLTNKVPQLFNELCYNIGTDCPSFKAKRTHDIEEGIERLLPDSEQHPFFVTDSSFQLSPEIITS